MINRETMDSKGLFITVVHSIPQFTPKKKGACPEINLVKLN